MIRRYCDVCDSELTPLNEVSKNTRRLRGENACIMFEVTTGLRGTWNAGDFCKYCVIDIINEQDDRPKTSHD